MSATDTDTAIGTEQLILSPSQTIGPLWSFSLIYDGCQEAVDPAEAYALTVSGQVFDGKGPVGWPDALVEVWHSDELARCQVDPEGRYRVVVSRPVSTHLPDGRAQAPFLHMAVFARGLLKQAYTRVYLPDEPEANADDPVLGLVDPSRVETLIARPSESGIRFDFHLQGPDETVIFAI